MNTQSFKLKIKNIRKEALKVGFSKVTMDGYLKIWNSYIKWKGKDSFNYDSDEYSKFLLEYYGFDVNTYSNKSKSWHQQLMRSKRILDDFESYKNCITRNALPTVLYSDYPKEWQKVINDSEYYFRNVRQNSERTISEKKKYSARIFSFFYHEGITSLENINKKAVISFVNIMINKTYRVRERYLYVLKELLEYLLIENIIKNDLTIFVPKIKTKKRKRIPTVLKPDDVQKLLDSINRETKIEKRDYAIILLAARLGIRIDDILNIRFKDIDWQNNKINIHQNKNHNLNVMPLSKEIGWTIIDYIKNARPKCNNKYLFVKAKYPFDKMTQFTQFNKYFDKVGIKIDIYNKKGIHNLRTTKATQMSEEGIPVGIIASTLGDTVDTVSSTYIRSSEKLLEQCSLEVDE